MRGTANVILRWVWSLMLLASVVSHAWGQSLEADQSGDGARAGAAQLAQVDDEVAAQAEKTAAQDERIQKTLSGRFARFEPLSNVEVEAAAGIVTLRGLVDDEQQRELATQLAKSIDGVVAVNNRLQFDTALNRRLAPVLSDGLDRLRRLVISIPLLLVAGLVIYLAYLIGWWITRWQRPFSRLRNPFLADLLRHSVRLVILGAGTLVALNLLGATALVSAVLGAAGIAGLALGFAFRDLVENYIAGILLSLRQPFAPDDHVKIEEQEGRVAALTSRATSLITLDGNHLRLPNALVFKGVILNYTRNPTRMFAFDVDLVPGTDINSAQTLAREAIVATPGVQETPPPGVLVQELTNAGVQLVCSGWVDQRSFNFFKVRSAALRNVAVALEEAAALPDLVRRIELVGAQQADSEEAVAASDALERVRAMRNEPADVSVESSVDDQLQDERRALASHNLLRADAPRE